MTNPILKPAPSNGVVHFNPLTVSFNTVTSHLYGMHCNIYGLKEEQQRRRRWCHSVTHSQPCKDRRSVNKLFVDGKSAYLLRLCATLRALKDLSSFSGSAERIYLTLNRRVSPNLAMFGCALFTAVGSYWALIGWSASIETYMRFLGM